MGVKGKIEFRVRRGFGLRGRIGPTDSGSRSSGMKRRSSGDRVSIGVRGAFLQGGWKRHGSRSGGDGGWPRDYSPSLVGEDSRVG